MTVFSWGVYGVLLGMGRQGMLDSPAGAADFHNAGLKAFLIVGVAYFVVAVVAPIFMLKSHGSNWSFTFSGITWSFVAGTAGALGAFTLILSLGAGFSIYKGAVSAAVMPIVFGCAPIVNSIVVILKTRGFDGFKTLPFPYAVGVLLAALGGIMVAMYTPLPPAPPAAAAKAEAPAPAPVTGPGTEPKPDNKPSEPVAPTPAFPLVPTPPSAENKLGVPKPAAEVKPVAPAPPVSAPVSSENKPVEPKTSTESKPAEPSAPAPAPAPVENKPAEPKTPTESKPAEPPVPTPAPAPAPVENKPAEPKTPAESKPAEPPAPAPAPVSPPPPAENQSTSAAFTLWTEPASPLPSTVIAPASAAFTVWTESAASLSSTLNPPASAAFTVWTESVPFLPPTESNHAETELAQQPQPAFVGA